ncbi:hypothetical protein [Lactiplantibacillus plantarum]|uniref:hypothetical protein n=1 Tax=Lactiplantibacillus plantarum TaxID=1590 RepID=UPI000708F8D0|nr:hypothetical protein [Lactiplantibacillus plantarum]
MSNFQNVFEGLHCQLRENRNLIELRRLRDAIIASSNEGKTGMEWSKTVIDDDARDALLNEGIVVIPRASRHSYVIDWSSVYEEE